MPLPPHVNPGDPDTRSPGRYLAWLVTIQRWRVLRGVLWSSLWLAGIALEPYLIRGAIDHGLVARDSVALRWWATAMVVTACVTAGVGLLRHRALTFVRLEAAYRTVQVVTRQVARLGSVVPRQVVAGEVVTVSTADVWHLATVMTMTGMGVGSLLVFILIAVLVLAISPALGLLVLLGVPAVTVVVGPLLGRLQRTESAYRHQQAQLTARAGDIVAGLRVLRGIGGERVFTEQYQRRSEVLRAEGYRVGSVSSWLRALAVGLPGIFVALVTWLAARMVAQGAITVGDMVAIYAYAAVLALPVGFFIGSTRDLVRGLVAARRVVGILALEPEADQPGRPSRGVDWSSDLHDPASGVTVPAGQLLAVATADHAARSLADRLGRYIRSEVTVGGVALTDLPLTEVRRRILVADGGDAYLFAGTLRDAVSPPGEVDDAWIARCLHAAAAEDVLDGLPDRLDTRIGTQARTLSGGQRQRLRLTRALLADPAILILLEPTSAVDAHTEAAIIDRLREVRAGRTTVVATTSPIVLDRADQVVYLVDGEVDGSGSHAGLLASCPGYRDLVVRGEQRTRHGEGHQ